MKSRRHHNNQGRRMIKNGALQRQTEYLNKKYVKTGMMKINLKEVMLDGHLVRKVCCPGCGVWGIIDDDQFHGRVSILCECGFHETINLAELWPKVQTNERDSRQPQ